MTKLQADKHTEHFSESTGKGRGDKRVSFPPDEEIVSGFAEYKDTQNAGELCFAVLS